jgi:RNA polymerase sigma-70 factor (ECF subfamily)
MRMAIVRSVGRGRSHEGRIVMDKRSLSDGEIIEAVRRGDRNAYRLIVDRYKRQAYGMALGLLGNPQDALDVSQAAFIKAYRNLKHFDTRRSFFPWFYRIQRNLCLDHIRRIRRRREVPLTEALEFIDDSVDYETRQSLRRAIDGLSADHREIIVLHYFEGLSYKEIAALLGKPMGTVMSALHSARKQLRKALKGERQGSERGA